MPSSNCVSPVHGPTFWHRRDRCIPQGFFCISIQRRFCVVIFDSRRGLAPSRRLRILNPYRTPCIVERKTVQYKIKYNTHSCVWHLFCKVSILRFPCGFPQYVYEHMYSDVTRKSDDHGMVSATRRQTPCKHAHTVGALRFVRSARAVSGRPLRYVRLWRADSWLGSSPCFSVGQNGQNVHGFQSNLSVEHRELISPDGKRFDEDRFFNAAE